MFQNYGLGEWAPGNNELQHIRSEHKDEYGLFKLSSVIGEEQFHKVSLELVLEDFGRVRRKDTKIV